MNNEVLEFRLLNRNDNYDLKWVHWSRIYEYPIVIKYLNELGANKNPIIHNSCWGWGGIHVTFKDYLDQNYNNVFHSDIKKSALKNTIIYDVTQPPSSEFVEKFDFVINISTIEEINYPNDIVINNLLKQVKKGGYLLITFDYRQDISGYKYNSIDVNSIENMLNYKLEKGTNYISGLNSEKPESRNKLLNCGILVIKKNK